MPEPTLPKFSNFRNTFDEKTGLSAVYDAAKMRVEEVDFKFPKSKFIAVPEFPAEKKPGEVYVKHSDKGLVVELDNEGKTVTHCFPLKGLGLPDDFKLTPEALEKKFSNNKNTLEKDMSNDLFMLGYIGRPFNLRIYKITPADPKETPFLLAINHAKSGSAKKDAPPRVRERKDANKISKILQKQYPDCTHFVWGGDSNEPACVFKDPKKDGEKDVTNDTDLKINTDGVMVDGVMVAGLMAESAELAGDNLVATDVSLPTYLIEKARIIGVRTNPQTDKGGETGNAKISGKGRIWVFKFQEPNENNKKANAEATEEILKRQEQSVPKGDVVKLDAVKTGSDHGKTRVIKVNGITMDAQALLETDGPRGFHSYEGLYKAPYDDAAIAIEHASAMKLAELILLEMGRTKEEIDKMEFPEREKLIHPDLKKSAANPLVSEITDNWKEQPTPPRLYAVFKAWIESDQQKEANKLLVEGKAQLQTEADIEKIFKAFLEKENRDNRIMDAVFRAEKAELSGGFRYLPNPRPAQLANYDTMISDGVDLRIAAGDGPKNHGKNYHTEMSEVFARLNSQRARPRRLLNTVLGTIAGAVIGTAAALAIGVALPLVIGLVLGSTAILGLLGLAYASYQQAQVIAKSTVPAAATDAPASTAAVAEPPKTVAGAPQSVPAATPAPVLLSKAAAEPANTAEANKEARRPSASAAA